MTSASKKESILVVDDVPSTVEVLQRNLASQGYTVFTAPGVTEALGIIETTPIDLVVTDFKMPKISGLDLVRHVRENLKDTEVIMITGYPSVEGAVQAVKNGAEEYLAKPLPTRSSSLPCVGHSTNSAPAGSAGRRRPRLPPPRTA